MFGTILVSMGGIALPVLAGLCVMPKGERQPGAASLRGEQGTWLLLRQFREYLGTLRTAIRRRHMPGGVEPTSSIRYG
jgi:hypothetical protein